MLYSSWGGITIKIGIEVSSRNLRCDLIEHPARYFFILAKENMAFLCIRTCDAQGEDIQSHAIDCLAANEEGDLYSIFDDGINDAILELYELKRRSCQGDEYPISSYLIHIISTMPDLADWIISSILHKGRNLVISAFTDA